MADKSVQINLELSEACRCSYYYISDSIKESSKLWTDFRAVKRSRTLVITTGVINIVLQQLREKMNPEKLRANDLSRIKGASSWLTMLPLKSENFLLNKRILRCTQSQISLVTEVFAFTLPLW